jgi:hypothetical protein
MRRKKDQPRFTTSAGGGPSRRDERAHDDPCCETTVHIHNQGGTVNIYNCPPVVTPPAAEERPPESPPTADCIPLALGSKPKRSLQANLLPLLANNQVPSVLAAAFFQTARRFLLGRNPANALETESFRVLRKLSPDLRRVLACLLRSFDAVPPEARDRIFAPEISDLGDQPVEPSRLAELVSNELLQRTSLEVFGGTDCLTEERPGLARFVRFGDDVGNPPLVGICRVNGLRTNVYTPRLRLVDYTLDELQQQCTLEVVNGQAQLNCRIQTENCPGNEVEGTCLRVLEVAQGEAVVLEGYNFFNVDARVRLEAKPPGTIVREVDAHVCGDETTPLTENVNGVERVILDCRVQDRLTFRVPDDLPEGIYGITVVFSNNSGNPEFGEVLESAPQQFIQIVPSVTATFQIATERLDAIDETWPPWWGSDEVGIRIIVIPVAPDFTPGEITEDNTHSFRFGDVDSGEHRDMNRVIFRQSGVAGVALSIIGHEIDNDELYEKQIEDFTDAYMEILGSQWNTIAAAVGGAGGIVAGALGASYAWSLAIAAAITLAIDAVVAYFGRADLIIEDAAAFTALDLATRLSPNFPPPPVLEFTSAGGVEVTVEPVSKDVQYIERRKYDGDDESEYHIRLRYNRL